MPFYRYTLRTALPPERVQERLAAVTRPSMMASLPNSERMLRFFESVTLAPDPAAPTFVGTVQRDGFTIKRAILYGNSFLPVLRGRVFGNDRGSDIRIRMTLHPLLWAVYIVGLGFGVAHALDAEARSRATPLLMAGAMLGMALLGFVPEALIARKKLGALLDAKTGAEPD